MKMSLSIMLVSGLYAGSAFAQATPSAPAAPPAVPAATAPDAIPPAAGGKTKAKDVRAECREQAQAQGLKGEARQSAVEDCFLKQRPDLETREKCRMDPQIHSNPDKEERKALIKECVKKAKG